VMDTLAEVNTIAKRRRLACELELIQELGVTACAPWLMRQLESAIDRQGVRIRRLPSGAGHDGQAMSAISDVAMLFVRCRGGISHNPAESITREDAGVAARTLFDFIDRFEPAH